MKLPQIALLFPLLFTILLALAACGGDEALSDEEYFQKMDEIDKETDRRIEEEVFTSDDPTVGDAADPFVRVVRDTADQADELKPPDDVKDAHEEVIAAVREFADKLEAAAQDAEQDAPLFELFENTDTGVAAAEERVNAAFCDLQAIADQKNITADVGCQEEGEEQPDPATLPAEATTEVSIQDFAFDPPHIEVQVGDTVTWTQGADPEPHTATSTDDPPAFDTGTLTDEGETGEFTFAEAGVFSYFCEIHPEMVGLVTVTQ
jgi:plastocyanin